VITPLRILVVDDSLLVRRLLRELLEGDPDVQVVGEAADGREALTLVAELRPDLITLDVRMPVMDGVETTRQIMAYHPTPILILTTSLSSYDVDITFQMLGAGALDVMEKPPLGDPVAMERSRLALLRKIRLLARVKVVTHLRGRRPKLSIEHEELRKSGPAVTSPPQGVATVRGSASHSPFSMLHSQFPVVAIGASTGGPRVIRQILAALPADFPAAVLVVQHIAQGFSAGMAEWLAESVALPVSLAVEGSALQRGQVLVAPDRYDLLVRGDGTLHLSGLPLLLQRPAIDIAMQSLAAFYGPCAIGVLLTGMGRDGARGLQAIRRAGGYTIAQDAASCTIYGMPRAAVELGAAEDILPPARIAEALQTRLARMRHS
jgi:two-component system, chemotaxis family, protein-glutamate methylesterase/glutaminase